MEFQIIRGDSQCIGLIGHPIAHSISPVIMNHVFRKLELPFVYIPLHVTADQFSNAIHGLRALGFAGAQVTIPYKSRITPFCDIVSNLSLVTHTVNTLYYCDGILHGTTTDAEGFFKTLAHAHYTVANKNVVILGNGGVARTIAFALAMEKKINSLAVLGRDYTRVKQLTSEIVKKTGMVVSGATLDSNIGEVTIQECSLLINCTPVGMWPEISESPVKKELLHNSIAVFDTIYNPEETRLLREAKEKGCFVQNGLYMLLYQGLESFKLWTGISIALDIFDIEEIKRYIPH